MVQFDVRGAPLWRVIVYASCRRMPRKKFIQRLLMLGVFAAVLACALFGVLFFYGTLLAPLAGEELFAWRVLISVPALALLLRATGESKLVRAVWRRLLAQPSMGLLLAASAGFLGVQLWLFTWAPLHGHALDVSLGYFLLPLVMICVGRFVFNERLSPLQRGAAAVAAVGVAHAFIASEQAAWPTFLVAFGYPFYFTLRKKLGTNHLGGLFFDMVLMLPAALFIIAQRPETLSVLATTPSLVGLVLGFGLIGIIALALFLWSTRAMSIGLFGLLTYFEPVFLVLVALILGERLTTSDLYTYGPIWVAIGILVVDGITTLLRHHRARLGRPEAAGVAR